MTGLEDLTPNAAVRGILPDAPVTVVNVPWFGSEAMEPTPIIPHHQIEESRQHDNR
jgi:hypothetical protein